MKQEAAKERQWQVQQQEELQAYREVSNALHCSATVTAACSRVQPSCPGASCLPGMSACAMHRAHASARLHLPVAGSLVRMQRAAVRVMYCRMSWMNCRTLGADMACLCAAGPGGSTAGVGIGGASCSSNSSTCTKQTSSSTSEGGGRLRGHATAGQAAAAACVASCW